jgi:hypothetical protein
MLADQAEKAEAFLFWAGQEGDPSSRKALLWMTANGGLVVEWRARRSGSTHSWLSRRAAPPALDCSRVRFPGPYGPGYPMPPLRGWCGGGRDVSWRRFALDRLMGGCRKAEAFLFWSGQEGDPSSRNALLWMTAKGGLGGGVAG